VMGRLNPRKSRKWTEVRCLSWQNIIRDRSGLRPNLAKVKAAYKVNFERDKIRLLHEPRAQH
jgi:hypothetical protein